MGRLLHPLFHPWQSGRDFIGKIFGVKGKIREALPSFTLAHPSPYLAARLQRPCGWVWQGKFHFSWSPPIPPTITVFQGPLGIPGTTQGRGGHASSSPQWAPEGLWKSLVLRGGSGKGGGCGGLRAHMLGGRFMLGPDLHTMHPN